MTQTVTLKNNLTGTDFGCEWNGYHLVAHKCDKKKELVHFIETINHLQQDMVKQIRKLFKN